MKPHVSIIYVYYNSERDIYNSLKTIKSAVGLLRYEVIVVDNNSQRKFHNTPGIKVVRSAKNLGYGGGMNLGSKYAKGDILLLTNPDILFAPYSIEKLYKRLTSLKKIGAIGPLMLNSRNEVRKTVSGNPLFPNGIIAFSYLKNILYNSKIYKSFLLTGKNLDDELFVQVLGGACIMVKASVFKKISGFDEGFFLFFEENDLSLRIRKAGFKLLFYPYAIVQHVGGTSMEGEKFVQKKFEESRFRFFKKYHGAWRAGLFELFARYCKPEDLLIAAIVLLSAFMNLYKINPLTLFIGDFGKDYLAARDFLLTGNIPIVGIQSSVVWLHQGPLSVYFIALAFLFAKFNPYAPAVLYSIIGVLTTFLVFKLGSLYINKKVGLYSALFFATSPLFIVNARMPYHTSPVPFFAALFFLSLLRLVTKKKGIFLTFFLFGLLLQFELANIVILGILFVLYFAIKPRLSRNKILIGAGGFLVGILPFIIYDVTNRFVYSIGFPLWIINRLRLFVTMQTSDQFVFNASSSPVARIYHQIAGAIFPESQVIVAIVLVLVCVVAVGLVINFKKNLPLFVIVLWLFVPILSFTIHSSPGVAYFPLIFVPLSLLIGYSIYLLAKKSRVFILLLITLCFYNLIFVIKSEYFLFTKNRQNALPPEPYNYGYSMDIVHDVAKFISRDSNGKRIKVRWQNPALQTENFDYLVWYEKANLSTNPEIIYYLHFITSKEDQSKGIFRNKYIYITKYENRN